MSNLKTFLKIINKLGYPNPDVVSIAKMIGYKLEEFLPDLVSEIGEEKAGEFTTKSIKKMSPQGSIKISNLYDDSKQYAYIKIFNPRLDLDNHGMTVLCNWNWGKTNILHQDDDGTETYKTIQEIGADLGMGEWGDYDELVDNIKEECHQLVFNNCGFGIWWDEKNSP